MGFLIKNHHKALQLNFFSWTIPIISETLNLYCELRECLGFGFFQFFLELLDQCVQFFSFWKITQPASCTSGCTDNVILFLDWWSSYTLTGFWIFKRTEKDTGSHKGWYLWVLLRPIECSRLQQSPGSNNELVYLPDMTHFQCFPLFSSSVKRFYIVCFFNQGSYLPVEYCIYDPTL